MPRHLYGSWTLCNEPRTRIVASNRHRRRHIPVVAAGPPANVIYERPADERKAGFFRRAAQAMRRVIGG